MDQNIGTRGANPSRHLSRKQLKSVQDAIELIERHLTDPLSEEAVTQLFVSQESDFENAFVEAVGARLLTYLFERRLTEAAYTLRKTDLRLFEVAKRFQFEDERAFVVAFARLFGITPKEYRSDLKQTLSRARKRFRARTE